MSLTDTHAHLYWDSFKLDLDDILKRAIDAGVDTIINVGVDLEKSREALEQVTQISWPSPLKVYSTIGIHPHEANKYVDDSKLAEDINELEKIYLSNPEKVVAIGECGLDFFFENNPDYNPTSLSESQQKTLQIKLLKAQIDLAKKLNLPLLIHCRDNRSKNPDNTECWDEVIEKTGDHFGIYHCFSGLPQTTEKALLTKFLISFAGNLTYPKNQYLADAAKQIPLERIVLETDCPFLPPQSKRGSRNELSYILETAEYLAKLKEIPLEEIARQTSENVKRVFKLS